MTWRKYFKSGNLPSNVSPLGNGRSPEPGYRNYQSNLPEVYIGHPNRVERYNQYEQMDMDSEINAALDILAEFMTQKNIANNTAFDINFKEKPTDNEVKIIKEQLQQWVALNEMNKRIFKIVRNTIKYGDQVFVRDPETFKLFWVEMSKVVKVIVNEGDGKKPEQYILKEINPNFQNLTVTAVSTSDTFINHPQVGGPSGSYIQPATPYGGGSRFTHAQNESAINAEHIVHLSLTEGLDVYWPFGNSVLENVFKVFKQKELLEDAIIIYRVQRAPERRVFSIDVGNMPTHMAMAYVERIKNEIHQRRIPTQTGGGQNMMDATYNPLSQMEDYFFPKTADGRGSSVDTLQGASNLGEITDLRFFTNKLFRGLRIPSSYLPTGVDDGTQAVTDGRVGTALIQEWRFNQYCKRLQSMIVDKLDQEFKMFMRWRGINIDGQLFDLIFEEPQNFAQYRQADIDTARISTFAQLEAYPYMSKRWLMKRYLGLSEQEMSENETMWAEEQGDVETAPSEDPNLRSVGISPGGIAGDLENVAPPPEQAGEMGASPDQMQSMSPMGGAQPGAAAGASAMGTQGAI
ncbi:portal vertex protein [uncultured Caudovirales phage]|uniref:Portal vertex protein n=1 Tax=uncultured Caudovirales phage TaxID=2100421 RepID=A0A6J5LHU4_9CAUD|nr:portal vertex protein [uncultured Caudovirales phage]